jgi:hypothetical protein
MIVPSQLTLRTHTNFECAGNLATLDKLVNRFPLPPVAPPVSDTSLTHVTRLAAHSPTTPTASAMGQSFILTLHYKYCDIKKYFGQRWSWIGKRPSQLISCDDFFGTNDGPTSTFFMSHRASRNTPIQFVRHA